MPYVISDAKAPRLDRLLGEVAGGEGSPGPGVGGLRWALVKCLSGTPVGTGDTLKAQCYVGVAINPDADSGANGGEDDFDIGRVWLTLLDGDGGAGVPAEGAVYHAWLAGPVTIDGDTLTRAFASADPGGGCLPEDGQSHAGGIVAYTAGAGSTWSRTFTLGGVDTADPRDTVLKIPPGDGTVLLDAGIVVAVDASVSFSDGTSQGFGALNATAKLVYCNSLGVYVADASAEVPVIRSQWIYWGTGSSVAVAHATTDLNDQYWLILGDIHNGKLVGQGAANVRVSRDPANPLYVTWQILVAGSMTHAGGTITYAAEPLVSGYGYGGGWLRADPRCADPSTPDPSVLTVSFRLTPFGPLTIQLRGGATGGTLPYTAVTVNWGDGSPLDTSGPPWIHTYAAAGTYTITYTVTDSAMTIAFDSVTIAVI